MTYALAVAELRSLKAHPAVVTMHLAHGMRPDHVCGDCHSLRETAGFGDRYPYCRLAGWSAIWRRDTVACGKWASALALPAVPAQLGLEDARR